MIVILSVALLIVSLWSVVQAFIMTHNRKWQLKERKLADETIAAMNVLNIAQADAIAAYRTYIDVIVDEKNGHITRLIEQLRFWMPDETAVIPDQEGDEWYQSVNAIFDAEKAIRLNR